MYWCQYMSDVCEWNLVSCCPHMQILHPLHHHQVSELSSQCSCVSYGVKSQKRDVCGLRVAVGSTFIVTSVLLPLLSEACFCHLPCNGSPCTPIYLFKCQMQSNQTLHNHCPSLIMKLHTSSVIHFFFLLPVCMNVRPHINS